MRSPTPKAPWPWLLAALLTALGFALLVARFHHPMYGFTVFYQLDAPNDDVKIAAFHELPVYVHRDTGGYDGLYYAQLAHDPTLRDPQLRHAMDDYPYRARRILGPAVAWLTGVGQPQWIISTYAWLNVVLWFGLAALLWRILAVHDARGWLCWAGFMFSAGVLSSVRLALTDNLALLLVAASFYAAERWHGRVAVVLMSLAGLARETSLLAVFGLCKPPWFSSKNLARVVLASCLLGLWLAYVRWQIGPGNPGWGNFTWPLSGVTGKIREVGFALATVTDRPLAWATAGALVAILTQVAFILWQRDRTGRWWRLGAVYTGLMLLLGTAVWEGFPGAATRVLLPLHLAFTVIAVRVRASWVWLVLGSLSVFSGLLALRDVPRERDELLARDLGPITLVVRFGSDWFGREEDRRHVWLWTQEKGTLHVETFPRRPQNLAFEFSLRSLVAQTVTLTSEDRVLWRGEAGPQLKRQRIMLPNVGISKIRLHFSTETPAVPENESSGARRLAFALYDLHVALAEP